MTYAELKTNIANYLNRSDLTSYIDTFIDSTEAELNRRLRTKEMIKRAKSLWPSRRKNKDDQDTEAKATL